MDLLFLFNKCNEEKLISAHADGGPRSRVCACETLLLSRAVHALCLDQKLLLNITKGQQWFWCWIPRQLKLHIVIRFWSWGSFLNTLESLTSALAGLNRTLLIFNLVWHWHFERTYSTALRGDPPPLHLVKYKIILLEASLALLSSSLFLQIVLIKTSAKVRLRPDWRQVFCTVQ